MTEEDGKVIPVRVAVRIRPLVPKELNEGSRPCVSTILSQPQVVVNGSNEAFSYDYVFNSEASQLQVYQTAVASLICKLFKGYNVTILAYGQTGSGKTHTMGTADSAKTGEEETCGVIPRAILDVFRYIEDRPEWKVGVKVSFLELYKEQVFDLLSKKGRDESTVDIREDPKSGIRLIGMTEVAVATLIDAMKCLESGSQGRRTGATAMNNVSSRSHAVFTLHLQMTTKDGEVMTAKFHMVDLAGSERANKTLASGERFTEGVSINKGLLVLGNVISALGESARGHIPYRDSKLTRLLQDSLGGNSFTLMVACVSPADTNYDETVGTLRYADRARKIKNRPIINQDPVAAELASLRQQVQLLQYQLAQNGGSSTVTTSGTKVEELQSRLRALEEENHQLTRALQAALEENTNLCEKAILAETARCELQRQLEELQTASEQTMHEMNATFVKDGNEALQKSLHKFQHVINKISEIQEEHRKAEQTLIQMDLQQHHGRKAEDESLAVASPNTSLKRKREESGDEDSDEESGGNESEEAKLAENRQRLSEFGAALALRQAALSQDLQSLNARLAMKEDMVSKLRAESGSAQERATLSAAMEDLQHQVAALLKEKDELTTALHTAQAKTASSKLAEERRKRLQELELRLAELKKKIVDQGRVIKMREKQEEQLKKMNKEVLLMKQQRVKMVRQMREDNDKFRLWRQEKEREVTRLKAQERKRVGQIAKMERQHSQKQNVLRRKMEDAMSANKRLKDALSLHHQGNKKSSTDSLQEVGPRIRLWVDGELSVSVSTKEAQNALETLLETRKALAQEKVKVRAKLTRIQNRPQDSAKKEQERAFQKQLRDLEADLELRSAHIVELQQKIADANLEAADKVRWDAIQTMLEAKVALKHLFEAAVGGKLDSVQKANEIKYVQAELEDIQSQYEKAVANLKVTEESITKIKREQENRIAELHRESESKMIEVMKQIVDPVADSALHKRLTELEKQVRDVKNLRDELALKSKELEELRRERTFAVPKLQKDSMEVDENVKPQGSKAKAIPKTIAKIAFEEEVIFSSDDAEDNNDSDDPDWVKTPLYNRIKKMKAAFYNRPVEEAEEPKPKKRSLGNSCLCMTGKCKSCVCASDGRKCSDKCRCSTVAGKCGNVLGNEMLDKDKKDDLDMTYDLAKPAVLTEKSGDVETISPTPIKPKRSRSRLHLD